ncbi:hypothetical protein PRUPE_3G013900, partial [Prunus persica]
SVSRLSLFVESRSASFGCDLGALATARRVTGQKMIGGGRRTMLEPIPGEPNLPSPLLVPGTFEGFEFSHTFFGGSDDRCHRSSFLVARL